MELFGECFFFPIALLAGKRKYCSFLNFNEGGRVRERERGRERERETFYVLDCSAGGKAKG